MARKQLSSKEQEALAAVAVRYRYDPLGWAELAWDWGSGTLKDRDIRVWQADIMDTIATHLGNPETRFQPLKIAVASGHGIGKTAEMGMVANWAMTCWEGARVVVTANTENQLRTKTSKELGQWFQTSVSAPLFDIDTMSIKPHSPGSLPWSLDFVPWSEHNTEAFAGLHAEGRLILLLMDEASGIASKIWEVAEGALTDENTVIIWIAFGNPTQNVGEFRECFRRHRAEWVTRHICSLDVEGTNKVYLRKLVEKYGWDSDRVKVRVRGQFPSSSTRQLIATELVDAARGRHLPKSAYEFAPVVLSCDPAWTGDDDLVIAMRQGLMAKVLDVIPKNDNDWAIAAKLARYETQLDADAVFIDLGYGTGIKSAGDTMGRSWQLVPFSAKATKPGYANKRAEMWDDVNDWLEAGGCIPDDDELYEDLIGVETKPTSDGKILLKSKEEMRADGLPSPNKGDALALTFAYPVSKKNRRDVAVSRVQSAGSRYLTAGGDYNTQA